MNENAYLILLLPFSIPVLLGSILLLDEFLGWLQRLHQNHKS